MEILVRQSFTPQQIKKANAAALEFRRNRFTSGVAHLDDLIALGKSVILCDPHARKFAHRKARYRPHPDPNMRRVIGQCDVCKLMGLSRLYLNERDALEQQRQLEQFRRAVEYKHFAAR